MANIKDLKKRIKTTKSTLKITTAMKLVSAAKLARAQEAIVGSRPFASELEDTIKTISALISNYSHPYLEVNSGNHAVMLIVSSNKGLCGGYNSQLAKKVNEFISNEKELNFKFCNIGKKAKEILPKTLNWGDFFHFKRIDPNYGEIQAIADSLGKAYAAGEISQFYIAYNQFNSAISFTPTVRKLLPFTLDADDKVKLKEKFPFDFKYDVSPAELLNTLIPQAFSTIIYNNVLDAIAAEHGSRMAAMDSASKNSKEVIRTLTLKMNKLRQAAITTELTEVVSGAEALNG